MHAGVLSSAETGSHVSARWRSASYWPAAQVSRDTCSRRPRSARKFVASYRRALLATEAGYSSFAPKWRNWQTRRTQNPVRRKPRVGSTPTFGTRLLEFNFPPSASRPPTPALCDEWNRPIGLDVRPLQHRLLQVPWRPRNVRPPHTALLASDSRAMTTGRGPTRSEDRALLLAVDWASHSSQSTE